MSTVPTSGSASGIYLYENVLPQPVATFVSEVIGDLQGIPGGEAIIAEIESLSLVEAVAGDATADFGPGTVAVDGTTYSDSTVVGTSAGAFEFQSGGANYILANGPIGVTLDQFIDGLIGAAAGQPLVAGTLSAFKATIDGDGLGGLQVVSNASFESGAPYVPPCFVRGTLVATGRGEVAVEDLREGDLVVLATGGTAPVKWIGRRRVDLRRQGFNPTMRPVLVRAGALGDGLPRRDLRVSPDHALFLDGVLVPAGLLLDGAGIVAAEMETVEYFHVELPTHAVLLAEGAAAESYLDTGNRGTFSNASIVTLAPELPVDAEAVAAAGPCAEMVLGGPVLERIRAALAAVVPAAAGENRLAS